MVAEDEIRQTAARVAKLLATYRQLRFAIPDKAIPPLDAGDPYHIVPLSVIYNAQALLTLMSGDADALEAMAEDRDEA